MKIINTPSFVSPMTDEVFNALPIIAVTTAFILHWMLHNLLRYWTANVNFLPRQHQIIINTVLWLFFLPSTCND